jgi:2-methylisocitrate lyase-like PEP mutase family enzyme
MTDSPFTCPKCLATQPFKKAWMLTRYSQLTCDACQESLIPLAETVPRIHAFSAMGAAFIGVFLTKHLSLLQTILMIVPVVLLFNCLVVTKTVYFEKDDHLE